MICDRYDVIVVGGGHAGCEAALASARLGLNTAMFVLSTDSIALMPCNPNIGGTSKGHLVREIDALGGQMGINIDKTFIQSKMLNKSKGPAVYSLRAQADKQAYSSLMRKTLEENNLISIIQLEVTELIVENSQIKGVKTLCGEYESKAVILCTGTYLNANCIFGEVNVSSGPNSLPSATYLTDSLLKNDISIQRYKTGTPARIDANSIDFSVMEVQKGDDIIEPFSFVSNKEEIQKEQIDCYLTYTNEETHRIINENIHRSPLYSGMIKGVGPRYCPSIEDKVVKFADKNRHQVFIEPEGLYTNEMYISGMSTSLPYDVQLKMYRSVKGLENAKIVRNGYAIEYDSIKGDELLPTLELKKVSGLYSAGQINGSSGYEEAAAQGLIAGINAAMKILDREPIVLKRSDAYIGVLIDDLCTKDSTEPYRMMTSRAEYRLVLRQDNADLRLTPIGYNIGLISEERYNNLCNKKESIEKEISRMENTPIGANKDIQKFLESINSTQLKTGTTLAELLKRPEINYDTLSAIDKDRKYLPEDVKEQVEINIKYDGYIKRQESAIKQFKKLENMKIPTEINYNDVGSLRIEAIQKLEKFRPISIGQASRIAGVSPADISVLLVYLEKYRRIQNGKN